MFSSGIPELTSSGPFPVLPDRHLKGILFRDEDRLSPHFAQSGNFCAQGSIRASNQMFLSSNNQKVGGENPRGNGSAHSWSVKDNASKRTFSFLPDTTEQAAGAEQSNRDEQKKNECKYPLKSPSLH